MKYTYSYTVIANVNSTNTSSETTTQVVNSTTVNTTTANITAFTAASTTVTTTAAPSAVTNANASTVSSAVVLQPGIGSWGSNGGAGLHPTTTTAAPATTTAAPATTTAAPAITTAAQKTAAPTAAAPTTVAPTTAAPTTLTNAVTQAADCTYKAVAALSAETKLCAPALRSTAIKDCQDTGGQPMVPYTTQRWKYMLDLGGNTKYYGTVWDSWLGINFTTPEWIGILGIPVKTYPTLQWATDRPIAGTTCGVFSRNFNKLMDYDSNTCSTVKLPYVCIR